MRITIELYSDTHLLQTDELQVFPVLASAHVHRIDIGQAIKDRVQHALEHLLPPEAHRNKHPAEPHHHQPATPQPPKPIHVRLELANHGVLVATIPFHFTPTPGEPNVACFNATQMIEAFCSEDRRRRLRDKPAENTVDTGPDGQ